MLGENALLSAYKKQQGVLRMCKHRTEHMENHEESFSMVTIMHTTKRLNTHYMDCQCSQGNM